MLELNVEWLDAPQVRDPVLQRTWCRLEILADGQVVTRYNSITSGSVRDAIYVSAFPLAKWVVNNWWTILNEPPRNNRVFDGTRKALHGLRPPALRSWLARHSILFGRDGMRFPDLILYREETGIRLQWFIDPAGPNGAFVSEGQVLLDAEVVEARLREFVQNTLERIENGDQDETDEVREFRANWNAIETANTKEETLAKIFGRLGLDPYDEHNWDRSLLNTCNHLIDSTLGDLTGAASDFLGATRRSDLHEDLGATERFLRCAVDDYERELALKMRHASFPSQPLPAHEYGYRHAEQLRGTLGLNGEPIDDLPALLEEVLGDLQYATERESKNVIGLAYQGDQAGLVGQRDDFGSSTGRFFLGRAAYTWHADVGELLITDGHDWHQRASRAFAAELLAPQTALLDRVDESADTDDIEQLADEYNVSSMLIGHQLENSGVVSL